jgi:hypothetical protein
MYTHVIKYKNYKIKGKIKNNLLFGRQRLKDVVGNQPPQKDSKTPSQSLKAGCGGTRMPSQLCGMCKQENHRAGCPGINMRLFLKSN